VGKPLDSNCEMDEVAPEAAVERRGVDPAADDDDAVVIEPIREAPPRDERDWIDKIVDWVVVKVFKLVFVTIWYTLRALLHLPTLLDGFEITFA